jgi:hypothetical protein
LPEAHGDPALERRIQLLPLQKQVVVRGLMLLAGLLVEIATRPIAIMHMLPPEVFIGRAWEKQADVLKKVWLAASRAVSGLAPGILTDESRP